ncbi:MAG TPA: phage Gp37/Gp68 family protein, partial [Anaerohalosphaeraceae bacterium]|nr:phage Gp37/Gp68 family protein [Anaerohalosphaeraceae bacterium]
MSTQSSIEWTECTWNPVSGCTKISPGCANCYAERMAKRLQAMGQYRYRNGFKVTLHSEAIKEPHQWKKPRVVFVNSMSDLFHEDIPAKYIQSIFEVMNNTPRHTYQILTKRSERLAELAPILNWSENIWMGVTVENNRYLHRVDHLRQVDAHIRFLSLEPLLGPLDELNLHGINWVIVGGESGPNARPIKEEWILTIKNKCVFSDVPFFFK